MNTRTLLDDRGVEELEDSITLLVRTKCLEKLLLV